MNTTFFKTGIIYATALGCLLFIAHQSHARTFKDLRVRNCLQAGSLNVCRNARIGGNLTVNGTIFGPNGGPFPVFDVDNGADVVPLNGIVQVSGLSGTGFVPSGLETHNGGTNDLFIENRRWLTQYVVDASAQVGARGTFQTIQAAMDAAAAAGGNAYISVRPGTYTENLTFRANIHLGGACTDGRQPLVNVVGNHTYSEEGACIIEDIAFNATGGVLFTITPTAGLSIFAQKYCSNTNTGGSLALVNGGVAGFAVYAQVMCQSTVSGNGIVVVDNALSILNGTTLDNTTAVPLVQVTGSGSVTVEASSSLNSQGDVFSVESAGALVQIQNSSASSPAGFFVNFVAAGAVGATHVTVNTTDVSGNNVFGAGSYQYADVVSLGSNGISLATTQIPANWQPYATADVEANAVRGTAGFAPTQFDVTNGFVTLFSPFFSYTSVVSAQSPYTVLDTDSYISVDSSGGAVIIDLPASPVPGRTFTIKDGAGTATSNAITVQAGGGTVNIDGQLSQTISTTNYGSMQVIFNGATYEIYSAFNFTVP